MLQTFLSSLEQEMEDSGDFWALEQVLRVDISEPLLWF